MREINSDKFRKAFWDAWQEMQERNGHELTRLYASDFLWTDFVLKRDDSFIRLIVDYINKNAVTALELRREWYTVDAMLVSGEDLFRDGLTYPSRVEAVIEHENGNNWEEEMWKLLHWRAPLKVMIGYDYHKEDRDSSEKKRQWLPDKLDRLRIMHSRVNDHFPETDAEYLLIVGSREDRKSKIGWRWCRIDESESCWTEFI